ncbi:FixH family protein [Paenibacillus rhizophilus]|uniref:YtkA-like domain-containing protein n=1 Tax=Paenibacillus rhizophilus TaxID=1850366 RepID=A0A3N9PAK7_9BACL|nr:FixH family protein [Paenibacillus rhizophilus]RQW13278.1 hypothetical protein EH198_02265 [Paenibacillus rhizophilus]
MSRLILKKIVYSMVIAATLTGCSSVGNKHTAMDMSEMSMEPIKVELTWSPAEAAVHQEITFEARITQGGDVVYDANEVLFEVVNTADPSKKLELTGQPDGEGKYTAVGALEEAGTYSVTSHATARTQHSMPTKPLTVKP